ncbi:hypothetical protein HDU98_006867 [Podochytrium sp. JEL0797]|nr:hypothetical protein HDU98_006867 [Podochytrium sp. JEL0797]
MSDNPRGTSLADDLLLLRQRGAVANNSLRRRAAELDEEALVANSGGKARGSLGGASASLSSASNASNARSSSVSGASSSSSELKPSSALPNASPSSTNTTHHQTKREWLDENSLSLKSNPFKIKDKQINNTTPTFSQTSLFIKSIHPSSSDDVSIVPQKPLIVKPEPPVKIGPPPSNSSIKSTASKSPMISNPTNIADLPSINHTSDPSPTTLPGSVLDTSAIHSFPTLMNTTETAFKPSTPAFLEDTEHEKEEEEDEVSRDKEMATPKASRNAAARKDRFAVELIESESSCEEGDGGGFMLTDGLSLLRGGDASQGMGGGFPAFLDEESREVSSIVPGVMGGGVRMDSDVSVFDESLGFKQRVVGDGLAVGDGFVVSDELDASVSNRDVLNDSFGASGCAAFPGFMYTESRELSSVIPSAESGVMDSDVSVMRDSFHVFLDGESRELSCIVPAARRMDSDSSVCVSEGARRVEVSELDGGEAGGFLTDGVGGVNELLTGDSFRGFLDEESRELSSIVPSATVGTTRMDSDASVCESLGLKRRVVGGEYDGLALGDGTDSFVLGAGGAFPGFMDDESRELSSVVPGAESVLDSDSFSVCRNKVVEAEVVAPTGILDGLECDDSSSGGDGGDNARNSCLIVDKRDGTALFLDDDSREVSSVAPVAPPANAVDSFLAGHDPASAERHVQESSNDPSGMETSGSMSNHGSFLVNVGTHVEDALTSYFASGSELPAFMDDDSNELSCVAGERGSFSPADDGRSQEPLSLDASFLIGAKSAAFVMDDESGELSSVHPACPVTEPEESPNNFLYHEDSSIALGGSSSFDGVPEPGCVAMGVVETIPDHDSRPGGAGSFSANPAPERVSEMGFTSANDSLEIGCLFPFHETATVALGLDPSLSFNASECETSLLGVNRSPRALPMFLGEDSVEVSFIGAAPATAGSTPRAGRVLEASFLEMRGAGAEEIESAGMESLDSFVEDSVRLEEEGRGGDGVLEEGERGQVGVNSPSLDVESLDGELRYERVDELNQGGSRSEFRFDLDMMPKIELDFDTNWFTFPSDTVPSALDTPTAPPQAPASPLFPASESAYISKCVLLAGSSTPPNHPTSSPFDSDSEPDSLSRAFPSLPARASSYSAGEREDFRMGLLEFEKPIGRGVLVPASSCSTLNEDGEVGGASSGIGRGGEEEEEAFFLEEGPSLEVESNRSCSSLDLDSFGGRNALGGEEEMAVAPPLLPVRTSSKGVGKLWRSGSMTESISSVFSGKSLKGLWNRSGEEEEVGEGRKSGGKKKRVRWGLARVGQLEQTKIFHPESPVLAAPEVLVGREHGILLFRLDSIDQISIPDNQNATLHMTLTYNNTTTFPIPPIPLTPTTPTISIDFECSFDLPPASSPRPPQIELTLRVSPVVSLSTELAQSAGGSGFGIPTLSRKKSAPHESLQSRSIALPHNFRAKTTTSAPTPAQKKSGLPLGGVSTRGVVIDDARRFAEESDARVGERGWSVEVGGNSGVKMRIGVKAVGVLKAGTCARVPESFSEAAYGIDLKAMHETVRVEGFLSQIGGGLTSWRRRYVKLIGCHLHAYNQETNQLMMTLNVSHARAIRSSGVAAVVSPKSERCVTADASGDALSNAFGDAILDGLESNASSPQRSFNSSGGGMSRLNLHRQRRLTTASTVDDAEACNLANLFEIEMKDGEVIRFSTLGESLEDEGVETVGCGDVWWNVRVEDECDEDEGGEGVGLIDEFLSGFDDSFEDIEIKGGAKERKGFAQRECDEGVVLVDSSAPVTKRWLHALANVTVTVGEESVPEWLQLY